MLLLLLILSFTFSTKFRIVLEYGEACTLFEHRRRFDSGLEAFAGELGGFEEVVVTKMLENEVEEFASVENSRDWVRVRSRKAVDVLRKRRGRLSVVQREVCLKRLIADGARRMEDGDELERRLGLEERRLTRDG